MALSNKYTIKAYDRLGQLTRVNDERTNRTWAYAYDQGGNIVWKKRYAYTVEGDLTGLTPEETVPYAYADMGWKDKLTAYHGKPIAYDEIGNPLAYDGWAYTWRAGRMLHTLTNATTTAQFTYDHTGLRVRKTVNGVDTLYTLNGKRITHIRKGESGGNGASGTSSPATTRMHFFYDAQGRVSLIRYNGVDYAYLHNLQGDITGIVDMEGNLVVQYAYDAWGLPTVTEGSLAESLGKDNPFRYRGYVWDEETGLYYLRSRYYNPQWGRFVNADVLLGRAGGVSSHNLYPYCKNSPILHIDSSGTEPVALPDGIINWQYDLPGTFGLLGSIAQHGCGAVAIHNANVILGRESDLGEVVGGINEKAGYNFLGLLGTNPRFIKGYFISQGDSITEYLDMSKVSTNHDAYIVWYHWMGKGGVGSHLSAGSYGNGAYSLYNDGTYAPEIVRTASDFVTLFSEKAKITSNTYLPVAVYGITKPKAAPAKTSAVKTAVAAVARTVLVLAIAMLRKK